MNSKILVLSIAVIAIGLFAMPSTLSLFSGQHQFYNGSSVNCAKCHQDIVDEIGTSSYNVHYTITNQTGRDRCEVCHTTGTVSSIPTGKNMTNISQGYNYTTKNENVTANTGAHAAVTKECASCHTGVPAEITGVNESHGAFYNSTVQDISTNGTNILKGANEACVGCHTHAVVNITWVRSVGYNMTVTETGAGEYNISMISVNGTTKTTYSTGQ
ncbi:MAG: hypothetical protein WA102_07580 [Candidatus Methanoperedens sp.]